MAELALRMPVELVACLDEASRAALLSHLCPGCREHLAPTPRAPEPTPPAPDRTYNPARARLEAVAIAALGSNPGGLDPLWVQFGQDLRGELARVLCPPEPLDEAMATARHNLTVAMTTRPDGFDELWSLSPEHRATLQDLLLHHPELPRHGSPPEGGWPQE